jgi:predicted nucleotidyltransferase
MAVFDPALLERIQGALRAGPPLRLAVLFGSRTTEVARADSDFDIGIVPTHAGLTLHAELALAEALSGASLHEVDLVRLDVDNPLLGREVAKSGLCLYEASPGVFSAYRARARSCWIDFEEAIAPHRARFLARLARAGA